MTAITGFKTDRIGSFIEKDPESVLDYSFDWSDWLDDGDTIVTSLWAVQTIAGDTSALTIDSNTFVNTGVTTAVMSLGTAGNNYTLTNTITTTNSLIVQRYFRLFLKQRSA